MAHHSIIYGQITGPSWKTKDYYKLHRLNQEVIGALPKLDNDFPWINQSMFNIPNEQGVFRDQIITFGASYKTLEYEWHLWLEKFEAILQKLYWLNTNIYAKFEVMGSYEYHWSLSREEQSRCLFDAPIPIENWIFESTGPRSFEEML
jgi:hypothetical protein